MEARAFQRRTIIILALPDRSATKMTAHSGLAKNGTVFLIAANSAPMYYSPAPRRTCR